MLCKVVVFPKICREADLHTTVYQWMVAQCNVGALILHEDSGRKNSTEAYLGCVFCLEVFLRDFLTFVDQEVWDFLVVIDIGEQSFCLGVLLDHEQLLSTTKSM